MAQRKCVLVTGAAGNLGRSVVHALLVKGHRVRAFDLPTEANEKVLRRLGPNVEIVLGDVTRDADVARAIDGVDAVAHLAGILPPATERHPARAHAINVGGTKKLVQAFEKARPGAPFVLASSYSVYGYSQASRGLAGENSPTEASDVYSETKLAAESVVKSSNLAWVVLRVAAAIESASLTTDSIAIRLMFEVSADQPIELVHGDDVALAFANAIDEPRAHRRTWPIGGGPSCQITQRQLFELSFGILGVHDLPASVFGESPYYTCYLDTKEAQEVLRFQRHDLDEIRQGLVRHLGPIVPLARIASPIVRLFILRLSGPYRGDPPRPTWKAHIEAGH